MGTTADRPRQAQAEDCVPSGASAAKRAQILAGAARVFAEHGYEGASMSGIARDAGVSKGTLYNYFDSKATLFSAFVEQCACEKMPLLFSRIDEGANLTESLDHLAVAMIRLLTSPLSLMLNRIIISEAGNFPALAETFWKHGPQKAINILSAWLMQHNDAGVLNIPDPVFAAEQFYALCQTRIAARARMQLPVNTDEAHIIFIARSAVRTFLNAYMREAPRLPPLVMDTAAD
ncbi:TetR family transcriptional regulator [Komagataeibacter rhaeticus]|uniref:TetR/AcrR family transcriptional regulator n=1 Tax=Komagataeibacter rhaeticus TaxID=215221 RepID=A0A181CDQ6_9PROT|nr:TetR/AcrR family transcriptional regulator [Komagataeibacter rhaeticus]ATU71613.1 TetR family transcriptional regulator [Komagataeibacter xylinus]EGG77718.1 HTH-type transcriptional repressor AcnR [Gluconacetobacter sp. SXCC-1]KDU97308.1 TetR family transcriptional regulator [Komagataeibacter rhaeticus AF1]MBL7239803.1 TetR/AcrR family transcriptional regulator [Komagataeibacter rhaeticus]PYD53297.1 TetR family transcriptional regulator [Komagataeibacter rhaeticus]